MLRDLCIAFLGSAVLYGGYRWFLSLPPAQMVAVSHWLMFLTLFGALFSLLRIHRMGAAPNKRERNR